MATVGSPELVCPLGCGRTLLLPVLVHTWPSSSLVHPLVDVSLDSEVWELCWEDHLAEQHPSAAQVRAQTPPALATGAGRGRS